MNEIVVEPVLPTNAKTLSNCDTSIDTNHDETHIKIVNTECFIFDGGALTIVSSSSSLLLI